MNTSLTDGVILKTDALVRVKPPAARHEAFLDEFEYSGMSGVAFAEFAGIKYQMFATRKSVPELPFVDCSAGSCC